MLACTSSSPLGGSFNNHGDRKFPKDLATWDPFQRAARGVFPRQKRWESMTDLLTQHAQVGFFSCFFFFVVWLFCWWENEAGTL